MKIDWLKGCATALVTPFHKDLSVDEDCFQKLVARQIDGGVKLLVPCGTTGESVTMSESERLRVIELTVEVAKSKNAFVIAGVGTNNTAATIEFTQKAEKLGVNAALVVAPFYNKPTQEGMYAHFKAIADSAKDLPMMLYNVPSRTASNISAATTLRLASDCANIVSTKEASGNLSQVMEILQNRAEGFTVFSGDDATALPLISLGADGLVSVASNELPDLMSQMTNFALYDNFEKAREIHYKVLGLMEANFIESSPAPLKFVMSQMNLLEENLRLPLVPVTEGSRKILLEVLSKLDLV
ncbi:MAG: 4-hydroxy-tetrahydrodipicolinate synthase [Pyrinomonadaceae bacterium]|nr:4-hydroxy-tetrahydrodipicolinate synthase [Pyrinomonadaceae bacterium]